VAQLRASRASAARCLEDDRPRPPDTVLCIDDDPRVLHCTGRPRPARLPDPHDHGGPSGLALAQREHPDVILLDVMLRG
jgi:CheY-like chemotaxis protein